MKLRILFVILLLICCLFFFYPKDKDKPKFIYSIPSLIIPSGQTNTVRIGSTTLIVYRQTPTLIDYVEEKISGVPFKPEQRVIKQYRGTNSSSKNPVEEDVDEIIINTNTGCVLNLPLSPASLPASYINPYYIAYPKPVSPGGFR